MKILLKEASSELTVKGSRFLSEVFPVTSQSQAREKLNLQKKKYSDATHVVHAFICGLSCEVCGMSDDGEPSGTAGRPVLDVLRGSGITNILLTVTRWFGGTLLGTGGSVKAYGDSAKAVLSAAETEEYVAKAELSFSASYSCWEIIKRKAENFHFKIIREEFSDRVSACVSVYEDEKTAFVKMLSDVSMGEIRL